MNIAIIFYVKNYSRFCEFIFQLWQLKEGFHLLPGKCWTPTRREKKNNREKWFKKYRDIWQVYCFWSKLIRKGTFGKGSVDIRYFAVLPVLYMIPERSRLNYRPPTPAAVENTYVCTQTFIRTYTSTRLHIHMNFHSACWLVVLCNECMHYWWYLDYYSGTRAAREHNVCHPSWSVLIDMNIPYRFTTRVPSTHLQETAVLSLKFMTAMLNIFASIICATSGA